jgi:hypothetical protein
MAQVQMEERSDYDQLEKGEEQAMCDSVPTTSYQMGKT